MGTVAPISSSPLVSDQNTVNMPSEITDIKQFLEIARRKDAKGARLKKSSKSKDIKMKIRCKRYLYTLILKDSAKADKIKQSLPPTMLSKKSARRTRSPRRRKRIARDGGTLGRKHAEKVWNRHERMTVGHLPAKGPGTNMFYVDKVEMLLSTSTKAQSVCWYMNVRSQPQL